MGRLIAGGECEETLAGRMLRRAQRATASLDAAEAALLAVRERPEPSGPMGRLTGAPS